MYDAIVVGARCGGSPTAMLLARMGYQVLLVDRDRFPSDTMSTHYIHHAGIAQLDRWGLLPQLIASGCPPIRSWHFEFGPYPLGHFILDGAPLRRDDIAEDYCPRRYVLDHILVEAAVKAGVEVREQFSVRELRRDDQGIVGITGRCRGGSIVTENARIVIGADGLHSGVARAVEAPLYHAKPPLACYYYSYWSGIALEGLEGYVMDGRMVFLNSTHDGLVCIIVGWPHDAFHTVRTDIEKHFLESLDLIPQMAELIRQAKRETRFIGTADLPNFFRKPYGPGWALVGDAGYHKDPALGQGITDAFRDAQLLTDALDAGWSGRQPLEEALAGYEQQRYDVAMPVYELNSEIATLATPPEEQQQLFAALMENPVETNRFFGTVAGSVRIPEFFAEENLKRIMAAA